MYIYACIFIRIYVCMYTSIFACLALSQDLMLSMPKAMKDRILDLRRWVLELSEIVLALAWSIILRLVLGGWSQIQIPGIYCIP